MTLIESVFLPKVSHNSLIINSIFYTKHLVRTCLSECQSKYFSTKPPKLTIISGGGHRRGVTFDSSAIANWHGSASEAIIGGDTRLSRPAGRAPLSPSRLLFPPQSDIKSAPPLQSNALHGAASSLLVIYSRMSSSSHVPLAGS